MIFCFLKLFEYKENQVSLLIRWYEEKIEDFHEEITDLELRAEKVYWKNLPELGTNYNK